MKRKMQKHSILSKAAWKAFCFAVILAFFGCRSLETLGNEALNVGDYDRAIAAFSKALDEFPADRDARYGLALARFGKAEAGEKIGEHSVELWTKTVAEFRILEKIDSSAAKEMHSSALFYLARAKISENEKAKVLGILNESLKLDSANDFSWNLKALALQGAGDRESAQKIFTEILKRNAAFAPAYSNLGSLYWEDGKVEDAWDIWSMGAKRFPKNHALQFWTKVAEDSLKSAVFSGNSHE